MKIVKFEPGLTDRYMSFIESVYPERIDLKLNFQMRLLNNPLLNNKDKPEILLALTDDSKIAGQFVLSPSEVMYKNKKSGCYFGSDFIVLNEFRDSGIGALLALQAIRSYKSYFAIGVSETAREIHLACNTKILGCAYKYVYIRKRLTSMVKAAGGIIKSKSIKTAWENKLKLKFPENITGIGYNFRQVQEPVESVFSGSDEFIEFVHSAPFLSWRFFSRPKKYSMYQIANNKSVYFISRNSIWRGLNLLFIVDYNFDKNNPYTLYDIFNASKQLAKKCGLDGVITISSLKIADEYLRKNSFKMINNPIWVISGKEFVLPKERIDSRNSVFITPSDSDFEFNFDNAWW